MNENRARHTGRSRNAQRQSPYRASLGGVSSRRGHRVHVATQWQPENPADAMLATRAAQHVKAFAGAKPLAVALTVPMSTATSMSRRGLRVVGARRAPDRPGRGRARAAVRLRAKVRVVVQSSSTRLRHRPVARGFRVCVIGHLRAEKDPLRIVHALPLTSAPIEVVHLGAALDPALTPRTDDPRYRWLGSVAHARALRWLASSRHAMVISSRMEGGANVVCEALRIGVPVIASRISGNVGLLGADYPQYISP